MSTMTYTFAAVPVMLPGNNVKVTFHYIHTTQLTAAPASKATPGAVHKTTTESSHVPLAIANTATNATTGTDGTMTTGAAFNPTLFFLGLFLLAISVVMIWYVMKRAKQNRVDMRNLV
ncbi:hypothetical protein [Dictyobacter kobayashii]|uniref:Uncharacterized protein n=1 Tax=Dictyobacter kobayashii TaxID=2014872 RepID=A0A402AXD4_9CHLR|nr:hypothetical protein [Dictyobacter kobayashii]GCE23747.1 hypothetical protein KDK_75470 [Dictyobacter kobayashii]